jgi:superfamily I DNA/RNA helicase
MATVLLTVDFLTRMSEFERQLEKSVRKVIEFAQSMSYAELAALKGVHLEPYNNARDPRARTMRVGSNHRMIAMDLGQERLLLVQVDTHDNVDAWMMRNEFRVNQTTNAVEIHNVDTLSRIEESPKAENNQGVFSHRSPKDLEQLGITPDYVPALLAIPNEAALAGLLPALPPIQAETLMELTCKTSTVEEIYSRIAGAAPAEPIDTNDIAAAIAAPINQARYHVVTSDSELAQMLAEPAAVWRTYLHHSQRALAYRPVYNGPARVSGGAGTGKTIVAIHRAKALAQPYIDRGEVPQNKPILFTTFTRNLAQSIERDLKSLGGSELSDLVDVVNVDALARRIVNDADPNSPKPETHVLDLWRQVASEEGSNYPAEFLHAEWEHVILAQGIEQRSDYFQARRSGRGVPLDRRGRAEVWKSVEALNQRLVQDNKRSFLQLAEAAAGYLNQRSERPYKHVIVDEAQDLHETQWHLLRAAVAEQPNDMFIVGDTHQRIYDRRTSLRREGIDIVGRSAKLRINYRTSAQILNWAMALLGAETYDDLNEGTDSQDLAGYHSLLSGEPPAVCKARSAKEQSDELVKQILTWINDNSIDPSDIGIAARDSGSLTLVAGALSAAGIAHSVLQKDLSTEEGVKLGTMHRMKGLEFRCVAVYDCDDDRMPMRAALTDKSVDELQHRHDLQHERCLLYVACTRARNHLWVGWSGRPSRFLGPILGDS